MRREELYLMPHLRRLAHGAGQGATTTADIQGVLSSAYASTQTQGQFQNVINQFASTDALHGAAAGAMAEFQSGQVPDMTGMLAVAGAGFGTAGAASLGLPPALTVALGVITLALPVLAPLSGGLAAASAILTTLLPQAGQVVTQTCTIGSWNSNIPAGQPKPYGPSDPRWIVFPLKPGQETCTPACPWNATNDCGQGGFMTQTWCEYKASAPGSFEQFALAALLNDYELGQNCQPNFVELQPLILACVAEWNAAHASIPPPPGVVTVAPSGFIRPAFDYTITPVESFPSGWNAPAPEIIAGILGGIYAGPGSTAQPPQPIHAGAFRGSVPLPNLGAVLKGFKANPSLSTGAKVALGTGAVVVTGAVGIGLLALTKGWAFGKAAEWVWDKTGGKVVAAVKRETRKLHR